MIPKILVLCCIFCRASTFIYRDLNCASANVKPRIYLAVVLQQGEIYALNREQLQYYTHTGPKWRTNII